MAVSSFIEYENNSMNKTLLTLALSAIALPAFATQQLSTYELKSLDCTSLAVEKANAIRHINHADQKLTI